MLRRIVSDQSPAKEAVKISPSEHEIPTKRQSLFWWKRSGTPFGSPFGTNRGVFPVGSVCFLEIRRSDLEWFTYGFYPVISGLMKPCSWPFVCGGSAGNVSVSSGSGDSAGGGF